ncbi:hypothetical protein [Streptomyces sp. KR80]|uniref:hypothetical protein n=1 Tax=Streptomyces sp. KR80 TaxID=3457426 RepID=UPI003FD0A0D4
MNDDRMSPGDDTPPSASAPAGNPGAESRGCLFALSQPPLMLFLAVIGTVLLFAALYDLYRW